MVLYRRLWHYRVATRQATMADNHPLRIQISPVLKQSIQIRTVAMVACQLYIEFALAVTGL